MDRNAYITSLENQLSEARVNNLTVQGFNERIEQISVQIVSFEERVVNVTRLLKLLQSCNDSQEQETQKAKDEIRSMSAKIADLECKLLNHSSDNLNSTQVSLFEERLAAIEKAQKEKKQFHSENERDIVAYVDRRLEQIEENQLTNSKKIENLIERQGADVAAEMIKIEKDMKAVKLGKEGELTINMREEVEKIEKAVNDWIKNVEAQLNVLNREFYKI